MLVSLLIPSSLTITLRPHSPPFSLNALPHTHSHKSVEYLGHLLGHEGKGSVLSALKASGYASDIVAGVNDDCTGLNTAFSVFSVAVNLTVKGTKRLSLGICVRRYDVLSLARSLSLPVSLSVSLCICQEW